MLGKLPSTGVEEALLGFDAREMFVDPASAWSPARRRTYLLRDEAPKPLSADVLVWPSLFGDGFSHEERQRLQLGDITVPEWRGPNASLWEDLAEMRLSLEPLASRQHWIIAVSWVSTDGFANSGGAGPYGEKMAPDQADPDAELLGFDVADAGLTSGLSDCGYDDATRGALKADWSRHLNQHHLFADLEKAIAFKDVTDGRVPGQCSIFRLRAPGDCQIAPVSPLARSSSCFDQTGAPA